MPARAWLTLSASLFALVCAAAHAHQMRVAMTTVLFNDRTERLEVMHRFFLHDAEHVVTDLAGRGADLFASAEDRQRFAVYVHERFTLAEGEGGKLPLALIGSEIEGDSLWVYQAANYPARPLTGLTVDQRALCDVWPDQVDTVNVERAGRVHTLTFRAGTGPQHLDF